MNLGRSWLFCLLMLALHKGNAQTILPSRAESAFQPNVNWLYGAYISKDDPLVPLTGPQRRKLYARQTFTTPGIYFKTTAFSITDHLNDSPPAWGGGFEGFAHRFASRQAQFVLQNSFVAWGNWKLSYEPRYDRCRCSGFWRRTGHATMRNFVTYDRTERWLRPQIPMYAGAFTAGVIVGTWKPTGRNLWVEGYRGAITQAAVGIGTNWLAEFAPDIRRILRGTNTIPKSIRPAVPQNGP